MMVPRWNIHTKTELDPIQAYHPPFSARAGYIGCVIALPLQSVLERDEENSYLQLDVTDEDSIQ